MFSLIKVLAFINKVIQIHETQLVRHGMMVVGEAGSGTSTSILILPKSPIGQKTKGVPHNRCVGMTMRIMVLVFLSTIAKFSEKI